MITMTDMLNRSLVGRAREASMPAGDAHVPAVLHAPTCAAPAYAATTRPLATDVATNPWLGGFGFGGGTGFSSPTVGDSTKRIHPGRLEGVT